MSSLRNNNCRWTLNLSKITKLKESIVSVKIKLKDGSFRIGNLLKDKGGIIEIKTMLGKESYKRKDVLKIEYLK